MSRGLVGMARVPKVGSFHAVLDQLKKVPDGYTRISVECELPQAKPMAWLPLSFSVVLRRVLKVKGVSVAGTFVKYTSLTIYLRGANVWRSPGYSRRALFEGTGTAFPGFPGSVGAVKCDCVQLMNVNPFDVLRSTPDAQVGLVLTLNKIENPTRH